MTFAQNPAHTLPIALTMGDPAGIAPEITAAAWQQLRDTGFVFFLIGDLQITAQALSRFNLPPPISINDPGQCIDSFADGLPVLPLHLTNAVIPGATDPKNSQMVIQSISMAVDFCKNGQASAIVTNPISKTSLYQAGFAHPGHTEFLGKLASRFPGWSQPRGPIMMLHGGGLRVALATVHCALHEVPKLINQGRIVNSLQVLHASLRHDFAIADPKIALCGLNPHAGEDGALGNEEQNILNPIAADLRNQGLQITDALPADALFREDARKQYDGVLAMYHDQGLIPVKTLDFHGGTNITLGLPFVRVSPDHGTGFDIAGKGIARADSLIAALSMASNIAHNRARS